MNFFYKSLFEKELKDIMVSGYIERNEVQKFNPLYEKLYFIFEDEIIEVSANAFWNIKFRIIDHIAPWLKIDEDDSFGVASIYTEFFGTQSSIKISAISHYMEATKQDVLFLNFDCLVGEAKKTVFINPKNTFGFFISDNKNEEINWKFEIDKLNILTYKEKIFAKKSVNKGGFKYEVQRYSKKGG